jgi:beta-lactamase superfamily II metal-dependent hydrolase
VGHGNSTLLVTDDGVAVVDAPTGGVLLDLLAELGIKQLDLVFISHSDYDHIGGLLGILGSQEIRIARIILGPDAAKESRAWKNLGLLLREARRNTGVVVDTSLNQAQPGQVTLGRSCFEVVYPTEIEALSPAGSVVDGHRVTSNDASAVLRIFFDNQPVALLCGDITGWAILRIAAYGSILKTPILVFPHHGGVISPAVAVDALLDLSEPNIVAFSFAREKYDNPDPGIVAKVRARGIKIACTQLSIHCQEEITATSPRPVIDLISAGQDEGVCCAGTMSFTLPFNGLDSANEHQTFVAAIVPTMCGANAVPGTEYASR